MNKDQLEFPFARPVRVAAWIICAILVLVGISAALTIYIRLHYFNKEMAQESRTAQWVGEKEPPKPPIKIEVRNNKRSCIKIEFAGLDSDHLYVFVRRVCGAAGDYAEGHWRAEAADGTVINSGYTNWQVDNADKGQRSEWDAWEYEKFDARTTKVVLWVSGDGY